MLYTASLTMDFMKASTRTVGTIIEIQSGSGDAAGSFPVVSYQDSRGSSYVHYSNASSFSDINVGDSVDVLYLNSDPSDAKLPGYFFEMWGDSFLIAFFTMFFAVGTYVSWYFATQEERQRRKAMLYTNVLTAKITDIKANTSISVNGRNPFQIVATWKGKDGKDVNFKSSNLWEFPNAKLGDEIKVKTDSRDIRKYWVDISFLEKNDL